MKVKELQKSVTVAWSPSKQNQVMLAAGTLAQLDASFSTNSVLELYSLNLAEPGYDMKLGGTQTSAHRFHKLIWSSLGIGAQNPNGLIVGGCESGFIQVFNAANILAGEDSLVAQQDKHNGAVRSLDINPFQNNLLASGACESEIYIWDLNNITTPMTPGTKTQPFEDVQCVAWNRQVQHILASVFPSRCVIWDLRKNEPIIKLSDTQSRIRWKVVQWHPDIPTQLWLASEEDQAPLIQLWDLRYATAPTKSYNIHQRGVLGLTCCESDSELMVSTSKDNKILCWNANSEDPNGEILSEIGTTNQWSFDVAWCPRNPALIACSSFDGSVTIHSILGGREQQVQTTSKIADSFPGMDTFAQAPVHHTPLQSVSHDLSRPPKWLKKPSGASFGFGGKLITFNQLNKNVIINQVVTNTNLVERSNRLESVLHEGNYTDYCREKAEQMTDQHGRYIWYFLKANFEDNPTKEMLNLLGYDQNDIAYKFKSLLETANQKQEQIIKLTEQMGNLKQSPGLETMPTEDKNPKDKDLSYKIQTGDDNEGLICEALLTGNIEAGVELCMESERTAEALILAMAGGSDLLARTQYRILKNSDSFLSNIISAIVTEDWSGVVTECTIDSWKEALVAALTHSKNHLPLLCERLGERLEIECSDDPKLAQNAILCYICAGSVERLVEAWSLTKIKDMSIDNNNNKGDDIQELVEVVMLLQKALEKQGRSVTVSGKLADILSQYASLLATQGSLQSALTYLSSSDDEELVELRERLYHSLGHEQRVMQSKPNIYQQQNDSLPVQNRFMQPSNPVSNNIQSTFNQSPDINSYFGNAAATNSVPHAEPATMWNTNPVSMMQPSNQMPPVANVTKPPSGMPPPTSFTENALNQPPRPSSVGSSSSLPRSKYILDPSVQASYGQISNIYNTPNQSYNSQPLTQPTPMYNNNPVQMNNNSTSYPPPPISQQPQQLFSPQMAPISTIQPFNNMIPQSQIDNVQQAPPMQKAQKTTTPPPPGWNDPPPLKYNRVPFQPKPTQDANQVTPITHPLFGQEPQQPQQQSQQLPMGGGPLQPQPQYPQNGYADMSNNYANQLTTPPQQGSLQNQYTGQVNYQNIQQPQQQFPQQSAVPPTPEPPKEKVPLPEEYIYLQTVFEELKKNCIVSAGNPQTKRKLEDVSKRLEILYDLLRENKLSANTLGSLNQLVQYIQIGDYANGIGLHTQMVSGPDFSQIASFMPGIKVLLQSAMQLQVYLR